MLATLWLCICGGLLTLLVAAISKQSRDHCRDYTISIQGVEDHFFVDEKDVVKIVSDAVGGSIKGQVMSAFNLRSIEENLERNEWIRDAELYFDSKTVLHVNVSEREPLARIFTANGHSFYVDSSLRRMGLSEKLSARVPVFTGFPDNPKSDSLLLSEVRSVAEYLVENEFWMSQIAQVDIDAKGKMEMIPVIGDHVIKFGRGIDVEKKFKRLFLFYEQVLAKTGFSKYPVIDIQYAGQVIGVKKEGYTPTNDTAALNAMLQAQLEKSQQMDIATNTNLPTGKPVLNTGAVASSAAPKLTADPNPLKAQTESPTLRKPKAVMRKVGDRR